MYAAIVFWDEDIEPGLLQHCQRTEL